MSHKERSAARLVHLYERIGALDTMMGLGNEDVKLGINIKECGFLHLSQVCVRVLGRLSEVDAC